MNNESEKPSRGRRKPWRKFFSSQEIKKRRMMKRLLPSLPLVACYEPERRRTPSPLPLSPDAEVEATKYIAEVEESIRKRDERKHAIEEKAKTKDEAIQLMVRRKRTRPQLVRRKEKRQRIDSPPRFSVETGEESKKQNRTICHGENSSAEKNNDALSNSSTDTDEGESAERRINMERYLNTLNYPTDTTTSDMQQTSCAFAPIGQHGIDSPRDTWEESKKQNPTICHGLAPAAGWEIMADYDDSSVDLTITSGIERAIQSLDELTAETNNSTAIRMDKHIKLMKDLQNLNSNAHTTAETKRRDRRNTALMGVLHPQGVDDLSPAEEVQKRYEKALGLAKEGLSACIDPTGGRQETWNVVISRMEKLIKLMKDLQNM